jgi:hypothetical protein
MQAKFRISQRDLLSPVDPLSSFEETLPENPVDQPVGP